MAFGRELLIQNNLGDAGAIAQIEEDEVAVIAAPVDPAHENDLLACVGGAQCAAEMRAFEIAEKVEHYLVLCYGVGRSRHDSLRG